MKTIGLTGGIGSGKSSAAAEFTRLGIRVVDADRVARQVVEPGKPALATIAEHFGDGVIGSDGGLDRATLRQIVFTNPSEKNWLESLLHPLIREEISTQLAQPNNQPYQILESPLLLETNQRQLVEKVIVVDVARETQILRAAHRDQNNRDQIEAIIDSQMDRNARRTMADYLLNNEGTLLSLQQQVRALHENLITLALATNHQT